MITVYLADIYVAYQSAYTLAHWGSLHAQLWPLHEQSAIGPTITTGRGGHFSDRGGRDERNEDSDEDEDLVENLHGEDE
ncbi:hypothetical protein ONZ51_g3693 [Trametes cubensis]|uniref:Uncharacterized protein n=1 Tax=Trametes cubensis TaxID=1111947 RepID=A0AAD7TXC4_9APHY|nr:hypothetical protein ONZ51_g3693 [Trametes cubensis]